MTTMNGWPDATAGMVVRVTVGGDKDGCEVLRGDVDTVLTEFMRRFHDQVEPIVTASGWRSRAFNASIGGHVQSNHISGTAVDLNGSWHPYEKTARVWTSGFTAAQIAEVRKILADFDGVIRWGLDFPSPLRDGMHFEINVPPGSGRVATLARKIRQSRKADDMAELTDAQIEKIADRVAAKVWGYKNAAVSGGTRDTYAILRSTKADTEHLVRKDS